MQNSLCPKCKVGYLKARSGKFGEFFGCSKYPDCTYTFTEVKSSHPIPRSSPNVQNAPTVNQTARDGELILADEIKALRTAIESLEKFLKSKFN